MTEPPRRKRFQIHLSTAMVMMFVAGGIIWANVRETRFIKTGRPGLSSSAVEKMNIVSSDEYYKHPRNEDWAGSVNRYYGTPFDAKYTSSTVFVNFNNFQGRVITTTEFWNAKSIILNVVIAEPPTNPEQTLYSPLLLVVLALLFGAFIAAGGALIADYLDPSFRTPDEVRDFLEVPVFASIPENGFEVPVEETKKGR